MSKNDSEKPVPNNVESVNYQDQIGRIFSSQHPLETLHEVASLAPFFLDYEHSVNLKRQLDEPSTRESAMGELVFLCLPPLDNILQETKGLGIAEPELVSVAFHKLMETITAWQPNSDGPKPDIQNNLRWNVSTDTKAQIQEFIAGEYHLNSSRFKLIPLYYQIRQEFIVRHKKNPSLADWPILDQMVNDYIQKSPEDQQPYFKSLRYMKTKPDGEDGKTVIKDMVRSIHRQVYRVKVRHSSLDDSQTVDEQPDFDSLKARVQEVLGELDDQERVVIDTYFGFNDGKKHTLDEIGHKIGRTSQRVRQIIDNAERKMRHPHLSQRLRPFLDD